MVAKEFIDFFNSIVFANRIAIEDYADRLNLGTVMLFLIACLLVTAKQYLLHSISCYIPVMPAGKSFEDYLTDYCWVHGTIPLRPDEALPQTKDEWELYDSTRRITYYQWVPFVLGLQCIMFYMPHILWQLACAHRAGGDLFALTKAASDAAISDRDSRKKQVTRVADFLADMIEGQHDCPKKGKRSVLARKAYDSCWMCVVSKRLGTCLVLSYFIVKLLIIANAIFQVYLIQQFLGFYEGGSSGSRSMKLGQGNTWDSTNAVAIREPERINGFNFGIVVLKYIISGRDWPETLIFPRTAHCIVSSIRLVGVKNSYTAQCALPINMINEKLYIFFWFWIMFLLIATVVSFILWFSRMQFSIRRKDFIKRFLRTKKVVIDGEKNITRDDLDNFVDDYLCRDGVFLVRMLALNAGEIMAGDIVSDLYQRQMKAPPAYV